MSFWSDGFWSDGFWSDGFWGADAPAADVVVDGGRPRKRKPLVARNAPPYHPPTPPYERIENDPNAWFVDELLKPQQVPAKVTSGYDGNAPQASAPLDTNPAAAPILADVAARAASAVQAKLEEADSAAALGLLAEQQKRHRKLVLLLALD